MHFEPRRRWKTNRGAARSFDACMRLRAPFDTRPSAPSVTGRKRARGERQLRRLSSYEVHLIGFQTKSVGTAGPPVTLAQFEHAARFSESGGGGEYRAEDRGVLEGGGCNHRGARPVPPGRPVGHPF